MHHSVLQFRRVGLIAGLLLIASGAQAWAGHDGVGDVGAGQRIYGETCIACHGDNGRGALPGVPDLTGKDSGLATESDSILLRHILDGFQDDRSPLAMPPKGGNPDLTIKDIQDVLAYLHRTFHYRRR